VIRVRTLLLAAAFTAAILPAGPAAARGPSTADQGSLDWLLLRLARDREEEGKGGTVVDPIAAFARGDVPLEGETGWKPILAVVLSPAEKVGRKAEATQAIVDRFKLEDEKRAKVEDKAKAEEERKAAWVIKLAVVRATMNQQGMTSSNQATLFNVLKIQKALLPPEWVTWKETDSLKVRRKAFEDLAKRVK
jgi:hypothetical protein